MENYQAQVSVIAKPSYYDGRMFVKYNTVTKQYYSGNTASTAVSESAGMQINGVTQKELKNVIRQLKNLGYSEYTNDWSKGVDTYGNISKAGL